VLGRCNIGVFSEFQHRKAICEIGKRIYDRGYVAANDGNISLRLNEDEVLATPTGVSKGYMTPDMIVKINMAGEKLEGDLRPSSEIKMHLDVYRRRPDVRSVIHAHPPTATGFAVAGIPLNRCVLPEVIISLGSIPIAKYGTPSTDEIPKAIREHLNDCDAFLLENHGALTIGVDLINAYFKMETLEHFAQISLVARQLGQENVLPSEKVAELMEVRRKMGVPGKNPGCAINGTCGVSSDVADSPEDDLSAIVAEVTKRVLASLKGN
jgi:L-fuculose-phosphate aldolase